MRAAQSISFRGKSVVITGGSRGLGLLLARQFGHEGARLAVAARNEAELERALDNLQERGINVSVVFDVGESAAAEARRLELTGNG